MTFLLILIIVAAVAGWFFAGHDDLRKRPLWACALCGWVTCEHPDCNRCNRRVTFDAGDPSGKLCPHCWAHSHSGKPYHARYTR